MTCAQEITAIIGAIQWWHFALIIPASFLWSITGQLAEAIVAWAFPSLQRR